MKTAANGYELMFDVNCLGHACLLEALHAQASMKDDANVTIVSSVMILHRMRILCIITRMDRR